MNSTLIINQAPMSSISRQQGLTLVELLIGLVLSLLLAGIMGTVYVTSKVSFNTNSQIARIQENLRFSANFLQRDIRELSYSECGARTELKNRLNTASGNYFVEATTGGIHGWEFDGTDVNDNYDLAYQKVPLDAVGSVITGARTSNAGSASDWVDAAGNDLPAVLAGLSPLRGSDVIMLASEYKTDIVLTNSNSFTSPLLGIASGGSDIGRGSVLKVGDCRRQEKFQNNSATSSALERASTQPSGFSPQNSVTGGTDNWNSAYNDNHAVFVEVLKVYYVGTGAAGLPSLFLYTSECGLSGLASGCAEIDNVELIEGVENLQIVYGEDTVGSDNVADIYRSAENVADFQDVVAVRIGVLMRSITETEDLDDSEYTLVDEITIDPPDLDLVRFASNMTLHLRNRGL